MTPFWKLLIPLCVVLGGMGLSERPAVAERPAVFMEPGQGIAIAFPSDWSLDHTVSGALVTATRPIDGAEASVPEHAVVSRLVTSEKTVDAALQKDVESLKRTRPGFTLVKEGIVPGKRVKWARYTYTQDGTRVMVVSCVFRGKRGFYRVECFASETRFQEYNSVFSNIIRSVQFDVKG